MINGKMPSIGSQGSVPIPAG